MPGFFLGPGGTRVLKPRDAANGCALMQLPLDPSGTYNWQVGLDGGSNVVGWSVSVGIAQSSHLLSSPLGSTLSSFGITHNKELTTSDRRYRSSLWPSTQVNWLRPGSVVRFHFDGPRATLSCVRITPKDSLVYDRMIVAFKDIPPAVYHPAVWLEGAYNDLSVTATHLTS
eukprot:c6693_g1_i1.p1 GENE.c6693_g1_i1~~c6693_g1_i1.p1  ORF type:complete len:171 (-),score=42.05 c6693_g1_i1:137-649(-)